jgi:ATP-binding cassette subfamily F protein uup
VAYYDQQRAQLQLDRSVMENVADRGDHVIINGQPRHASGYLRDFLFRPEQLRTPASALSGGERNRLLLAKLFASPANLLVMDEPTNDLDIDTLELLEEMVSDFQGTLLLVSHDRSFLDHVATELLVFTGEGRVQEFVGGYSDWVRYRDGRKGKSAGARGSANASGNTSSAASATSAGGSASGKRGGSPAAAPMPAAVVAPPAKPAPSKRKVSFKDQREFSLLPATIEKLEAEQTELTTRVNAPEFYSGPRELVQGALARMKTLQEEIDAAYLRWAELESVVADTRPE